MSNKGLFQRVKELKLPIGKYALFGSAPLGIRKLRDCHDIDIIVTEDLWNKYKSKNWEIKVMPCCGQCLWNDEIELWKDWYPGKWNIQRLIDEAEIIDGLPFVKLEYVVEWKRQYGREKDLKDVESVERFLRIQK
jgi:hypothetical protein